MLTSETLLRAAAATGAVLRYDFGCA